MSNVLEGVKVEDGNLILPLTAEEKLEFIGFFYEAYYNTDQDAVVFAPEYLWLTRNINEGKVPLKLKFLSEYREPLARYFPKYKRAILENMEAKNIGTLDAEELLDLLYAYDAYIQEANDEDKYETGWRPVCLREFYDCEFHYHFDDEEEGEGEV